MVFSFRILLAFGLLATLPLPAQAEGLPIELHWNGPAECGDAPTVLANVNALLGDASSVGSRDLISVYAALHKTNQGKWEVQLQTTSGTIRGERSLVVADCSEAMHATALLLAFMINPNAALQKNSEEPDEAPSDLPRQQSTPTAPATLTCPKVGPSAPQAICCWR